MFGISLLYSGSLWYELDLVEREHEKRLEANFLAFAEIRNGWTPDDSETALMYSLAEAVRYRDRIGRLQKAYLESASFLGGVYLLQLLDTAYSTLTYDGTLVRGNTFQRPEIPGRSVLVPGWGHVENGQEVLGYTYMGLGGVAAVQTLWFWDQMRKDKQAYERSLSDTSLAFGFARSQSDPLVGEAALALWALPLWDRARHGESAGKYSQSLEILGGFYAFQLMHATFSGLSVEKRSGLRQPVRFENFLQAAVVPGRGHWETGREGGAVFWGGLFWGSFAHALARNQDALRERERYLEAMGLGSFTALAAAYRRELFPAAYDDVFPLVGMLRREDLYEKARRRSYDSWRSAGFVYLAQLLHLYYVRPSKPGSSLAGGAWNVALLPEGAKGVSLQLRTDYKW